MAAAILSQSEPAVVFLAAAGALVVAAIATVGLHPSGGLATLALLAPGPAIDGAAASPGPDTADPSFLAGLRTVARDRDARLIVGLLTARTLMIGCADVLFVLIALDLIDTGEPGAGILNAALGAGTIVGGAVTFALIGREGLALIAAAGALLWGVAVALIGITAVPILAPLLVIVGGAGLAVVDVAGRTLLQRSVRDDVLTRVFGLQEGLAMAALAVGSVFVSLLAEAIGLTPALLVVALILPALVALSWTQLTALDRRVVVPVRAIALLRGTRLFAPLPAPQLEAIARRGAWLTFPSQLGPDSRRRSGRSLLRPGIGRRSGRPGRTVPARDRPPGRRVRRDRAASRRPAHRDGHHDDGGRRLRDRPGTVPGGGHRASRCVRRRGPGGCRTAGGGLARDRGRVTRIGR